MPSVGFGIVGTGMIARVVADAIAKSPYAQLVAVSSRRLDSARSFVAKRPGATAVEGVEALLDRAGIDAVYIAPPTTAKERIALSAIAAGKHVLVDKPFADRASVARMSTAAQSRGLVFMDATHFVHHPRTRAIQAAFPEKIGKPRSLHTAFYAPLSDPTNIRFDPNQEPMTALGDMGWYSMRAIVEYLRPAGPIAKVAAAAERDPKTTAIKRAAGLITFEGGEVSTFDVGYTAGTDVMTLELLGTAGVISMDDFVLDWTDSFAHRNPEIECGFIYRTGNATRKDFTFIPTPSGAAQEVLMIDEFSRLAVSGTADQRAAYADATLQTQEYLDAVWKAANS